MTVLWQQFGKLGNVKFVTKAAYEKIKLRKSTKDKTLLSEKGVTFFSPRCAFILSYTLLWLMTQSDG